MTFAFCAELGAQPQISSVTPTSSPTTGAVYVHIHGSGLSCATVTCSPSVKFGDEMGIVVAASSDEVVVIAPAHAPGSVDVEISLPPNLPIVMHDAFVYELIGAGDVARLLIPIASDTNGALKTVWRTDIVVRNGSDQPLQLRSPTPLAGAGVTIPQFSSTQVRFVPGTVAAFLYVPSTLRDTTTISIRVHDTSRDANGAGATVPSVPETQFRRSVALDDVPADPHYRALLRVYSYASAETSVYVAARDEATNMLLATTALPLTASAVTSSPASPAFGQLPLTDFFSSFATEHPRIALSITTNQPDAPPIWAFVSITNNVTQQVTMALPAITIAPIAIDTPNALATGAWSDDGVCMDVTEQQVTLLLSCASGEFPRPTIAPDGTFEADGTLKLLSGPIPPTTGSPAHFSGVLRRNTVTIRVSTASIAFDPVTLHFGAGAPCTAVCH